MAAEKIPFFVLSALIGMIAIYTQQRGGAVVSFTQLPIAERIGNAIVSYTLYLWKMIWPSKLAVYYPFPFWSSLEILASAALLTAISAGVLRGRRRFPYLMFGWLWYLLTLLPVIGLIKLGDAGMADRYSYITLIGPFVALAWGARDLAERLSLPRFTLPAVAGFVLGACMIVTYVQLGHWRDSVKLFTHALKRHGEEFPCPQQSRQRPRREGTGRGRPLSSREGDRNRPPFHGGPLQQGSCAEQAREEPKRP